MELEGPEHSMGGACKSVLKELNTKTLITRCVHVCDVFEMKHLSGVETLDCSLNGRFHTALGTKYLSPNMSGVTSLTLREMVPSQGERECHLLCFLTLMSIQKLSW